MPTPGFYLVWTQGPNILIGQSGSTFVRGQALLGIIFPNEATQPINIQLASSAREQQTFDTLRNVKLYLTGDPDQIATVQTVWPLSGGGLQISFDGGRSYKTFSTAYGYEADPSSWVTLPAISIGLNGTDGTLGAFDSANILMKYVIPENADQFAIYNVSLTADFDVA